MRKQHAYRWVLIDALQILPRPEAIVERLRLLVTEYASVAHALTIIWRHAGSVGLPALTQPLMPAGMM
jgi:hypothetical protein